MKVNILGLPHFYNFPIKKCIITETIMMSIKVIHFYHVSRQWQIIIINAKFNAKYSKRSKHSNDEKENNII